MSESPEQEIANWSWTKLGFVGVVLIALVHTVKHLWKVTRDDAKVARDERDSLLKERETIRLNHIQELTKRDIEHAQEIARVREELQRSLHTEQIRYMEEIHAMRDDLSAEKIAYLERIATRQEQMVLQIASVTQSLDTTMSKIFDRIRLVQGG